MHPLVCECNAGTSNFTLCSLLCGHWSFWQKHSKTVKQTSFWVICGNLQNLQITPSERHGMPLRRSWCCSTSTDTVPSWSQWTQVTVWQRLAGWAVSIKTNISKMVWTKYKNKDTLEPYYDDDYWLQFGFTLWSVYCLYRRVLLWRLHSPKQNTVQLQEKKIPRVMGLLAVVILTVLKQKYFTYSVCNKLFWVWSFGKETNLLSCTGQRSRAAQ